MGKADLIQLTDTSVACCVLGPPCYGAGGTVLGKREFKEVQMLAVVVIALWLYVVKIKTRDFSCKTLRCIA